MATSNRDRVGRGFELLALGLGPFVDEQMASALPAGADWVETLHGRDAKRQGSAKEPSKADPLVLLRVLTEEWRVFSGRLSRAEQSFASDRRDTRNRWAHNESFSADDAYRALDTTERLLPAVGAVGPAEEVRRLRAEHQRAAFEADTRRVLRPARGRRHGVRAGAQALARGARAARRRGHRRLLGSGVRRRPSHGRVRW